MKISDLSQFQRVQLTGSFQGEAGLIGDGGIAQITGLLPVTEMKQNEVNKPLFSL